MTTKPRFEITSLHIRGLRGLKSLDLPEDGMGWDNGFPPLCVIAGANGSGKTTLLRCITEAARLILGVPKSIPEDVMAEECLIDFVLVGNSDQPLQLRFLVGNDLFHEKNKTSHSFGYILVAERYRSMYELKTMPWETRHLDTKKLNASSSPRVVFMPSDDRDLIVPDIKYKAPGTLQDDLGFVAAWKRLGPQQWGGSTLELLFSARWADLNAKEEGRPDDANNFDNYSRAFTDLTAGKKKLGWTSKGELVVKLDDGTSHGLEHLSSGERQALLLLAELRRRWRPGSLVLIDELELHLHDAWQGKLLDVLTSMQKELGGQVIVTTQSHSLFKMAELGTRMILGRESLR